MIYFFFFNKIKLSIRAMGFQYILLRHYRYAFSQVVRSNDHESMKSHWTWISNILMIHKNDLDGVAMTKAHHVH